MSHSPYTNYSLLIRESCLSDILHTLITHYSSGIGESYVSDILHTLIINYLSGRVVHLAFSIHYLLITHR
jgi:hypothetical protein